MSIQAGLNFMGGTESEDHSYGINNNYCESLHCAVKMCQQSKHNYLLLSLTSWCSIPHIGVQ